MILEDIVRNTTSLPPAPEILPRLVRLMEDPDADANDLVELIKSDPGIAASVLRLGNSGAYSPATPITDLHEAVALLGLKEVYRIVSLVTSGDYLEGALPSLEIRQGGLWEHGLAAAMLMDRIAKPYAAAEGHAYTVGLLHDIGKLLLQRACGDSYASIFAAVETERLSIDQAEAKRLGFDHAAAGAAMLESWGFPEEIYLPIRYQYRSKEAPRLRELAGALLLSNWGAAVLGCNDGRDAWALDMSESALEMDEKELELIIVDTQPQLEKAKRALRAQAA